MDPEVLRLCNVLNALPGISTTSSCCGHGKSPVSIFLTVDPRIDPRAEGLFFLARCMDRRYWSHDWSLSLSVSDVMRDDLPPVYYQLESVSVGEKAYVEAESLVENMEHHLNHVNFIAHYHLDLNRFNTAPA